MDVSRRSFLGGALALTAATALTGTAFASVPVIHGDGVHDDTAGLQAAFDGKPFRIAGEGAYVVNRGGNVFLSGGRFKLMAPLQIRNAASVTGGTFDGSAIPPERGAPLHFTGSRSLSLRHMAVVGNGTYAVMVD